MQPQFWMQPPNSSIPPNPKQTHTHTLFHPRFGRLPIPTHHPALSYRKIATNQSVWKVTLTSYSQPLQGKEALTDISIHELTDSLGWLVLLWFTEKREYATPPTQRTWSILLPWLVDTVTLNGTHDLSMTGRWCFSVAPLHSGANHVF